MNVKTIVIDQALITTPADQSASILDGFVYGGTDWLDWIEAYHSWLQSLASQNTRRTYENAWREFFKWAQVKPADVTPRLANQYATHLLTIGNPLVLNPQPLSKKTVNLKMSALTSFYTYVQRKFGLWPANVANPFHTVDRHKVKIYDQSVYPLQTEAQAIVNAINVTLVSGQRDYALIHAFLTTCRRSSELLNLKWGDLSELPDGNFKMTYHKKGDGDSHSDGLLPRECHTNIVNYLKAAGRFDDISKDDYIFTALDPERALRLPGVTTVEPNRPLTNSMVNRLLKKYARRAGVDPDKAHIHALRHAGMRHRKEEMKKSGKGVDYEELQRIAGHGSIAITQVYISAALTDPEDNLGADVARNFRHSGRRTRQTAANPDQLTFEDLDPRQQEIDRLQAEIAQLKQQLK